LQGASFAQNLKGSAALEAIRNDLSLSSAPPLNVTVAPTPKTPTAEVSDIHRDDADDDSDDGDDDDEDKDDDADQNDNNDKRVRLVSQKSSPFLSVSN
jgi:TATA-binding protein-associated factor Taf7